MFSMEKMILAPRPQRLSSRPGQLMLKAEARIVIQGDPHVLFPVARFPQDDIWDTQHLKWNLWAGETKDDSEALAILSLAPPKTLHAQGYRLTITSEQILLLAADSAGLFYGVMTLRQMLRQCEGMLPAGEIEDFPDFRIRGVMLDVSRDKVPTLETLFGLVDQLSELKINHLELYTEHAFSYRHHSEVWAQTSPITGEDILRLDDYCKQHFMELVPNQNSFGHLNRWLELPRYNHLAECPNGCVFPNGYRSGPFGLNPSNPESLALISELYAELLPHFSSRKFNIGGDETFDLGQGASKTECETRGQGRVYLEFLLKLYELVKGHGRTMHFWGDIIIKHPELVPELPKDVVVLEWGYEADHPFDEHGEKFAQTGIPYYVCPGTSTWNSFAGRTDNCLENLRKAASSGLKHGAVGYLNTDWGDNGHLQYLPASYLGFTAGASLSWCCKTNYNENFIDALDIHIFRDSAGVMGKLAYDLGNAYQKTGHLIPNGSILSELLTKPSKPIPETVTSEILETVCKYINDVSEPLSRARMNRQDSALIQKEFANTALILLHACERAIAIRNNTFDQLDTHRMFATKIRTTMGIHRELWIARNRIGGIQDSVRILNKLLDEYTASIRQ